jgi:hypothetical protein
MSTTQVEALQSLFIMALLLLSLPAYWFLFEEPKLRRMHGPQKGRPLRLRWIPACFKWSATLAALFVAGVAVVSALYGPKWWFGPAGVGLLEFGASMYGYKRHAPVGFHRTMVVTGVGSAVSSSAALAAWACLLGWLSVPSIVFWLLSAAGVCTLVYAVVLPIELVGD